MRSMSLKTLCWTSSLWIMPVFKLVPNSTKYHVMWGTYEFRCAHAVIVVHDQHSTRLFVGWSHQELQCITGFESGTIQFLGPIIVKQKLCTWYQFSGKKKKHRQCSHHSTPVVVAVLGPIYLATQLHPDLSLGFSTLSACIVSLWRTETKDK